MNQIVLIAHNLRSTHNVGSLLRTCEGLGIIQVYLTGYTPYPMLDGDQRLPHLSNKIDLHIHKTALGAERMIKLEHYDAIEPLISKLRSNEFTVCALEQDERSVELDKFMPPKKMALLVGREIEGIEPEVLKLCDYIIEIPMKGQKESFNVVQAAAMALYKLTYN
jgi:23S rRNA (guanosine2251-2'-O)-methyltransferase